MNPDPEEIPAPARNLAGLCHFSGLCGCFLPVLGHILPPMTVWLLTRNRSPFIDEHGREALNFHIALSVYTLLLCLPLLLFPAGTFFIPFVLALYYLAAVVGILTASAAAQKGHLFFFPKIFRILR